MASNVREDSEDIEKQFLYVKRLVYDVLTFTLPKCGFPEEDLPYTNLRENVYNRPNFVELAGLSALRVALILRDQWSHLFLYQHTGEGINKDNLRQFLKQIVLCVPLSWVDTTQSVIESFLAVCNEVILFFYHEGINIDLDVVITTVSGFITGYVSPYPNIPQKIEELVGKINDIHGYNEWITDFINNFAIPYGSIEDMSSYFYSYVEQQWIDFLRIPGTPPTMTVTDVRDYLGFLPEKLFNEIVYGLMTEETETETVPEATSAADQESTEPQDSTQSSESGAAGGEESPKKSSADASEETEKGAEGSQPPSEPKLEDEFGQMSLGTEAVSQARHGAIPKRKMTHKKK